MYMSTNSKWCTTNMVTYVDGSLQLLDDALYGKLMC